MGMYDSIKIKNIKCPNCEHKHEEWIGQTKDFHCSLSTFNFPESFKLEDGPSWDKVTYDDEILPIFKTGNGEFNFYGDCHFCKEFFGGTGYVKNFIFHKYVIENKTTGVIQQKEIEPSDELLELLDKNTELKNDMRAYKEVLNAVLMSLLQGNKITKEQIIKIIKEQVPKLGLLDNPEQIYGRMYDVLKIIENKEESPKDSDYFL